MAHVRQIHIEQHAYERYCERVGVITYQDLVDLVDGQLQQGIYYKQGYVRIADVWWRGTVSRDRVVLHTCYGVTHIDVPLAIKWAKRFNDRLALGGDRYGD